MTDEEKPTKSTVDEIDRIGSQDASRPFSFTVNANPDGTEVVLEFTEPIKYINLDPCDVARLTYSLNYVSAAVQENIDKMKDAKQ